MRACASVLITAVAGFATCASGSGNSGDLDPAYRSMYNRHFFTARRQLQLWEQSHPGEPLGPVSEAASYLFAELDRLGSLKSQLFVDDGRFETRKQMAPDIWTKSLFEGAINRATALADKRLADDPHSAPAMLSETLAYGLEADYAAFIEKRDMLALSYI